ncbi:hypothetical protein CASFOL_033115 [Castilleja foliolosa]|uniref:STAS domain-containing protein n=1 Tax=Castilleja foliolosa TaxID=1961234 RepID=A0ABD3C405_9LAMI
MAMEVEEEGIGLKFPCWKPIRRRFRVDAQIFAAGNIERELLAKQVALDITEEEKQQIRGLEDWGISEVFCPIVGCGACLKSLDDFEDHYNARHTASCSVCSRVYPTSRLLSIHVYEAHDSFFQAKVARGFAMHLRQPRTPPPPPPSLCVELQNLVMQLMIRPMVLTRAESQVGLSIMRVLLFVARPRTLVLGNIPDTKVYRNVDHYENANNVPGILILEIDSPIYFANSNYLRERISRWIDDEEEKIKSTRETGLQYVVLDMSAVGNIDTSGISMLDEVKKMVDRRGLKYAC